MSNNANDSTVTGPAPMPDGWMAMMAAASAIQMAAGPDEDWTPEDESEDGEDS